LSADEQKEVERRCRPLTLAIQKTKGTGKTPLEALHEALKKPPSAAQEGRSRALHRAARSRDPHLPHRRARGGGDGDDEADRPGDRRLLRRHRRQALPLQRAPRPARRAALEKAPYVSTDADWDTPSWKCLGLQLTGLAQRFQYEVSVDSTAKTFTIIARGLPGDNGRWVTLRQRGRVGPKQIEIDPIERR
jgi:hypothetical protein